MKKLLLGVVLVATAAGCKSNPYCLNCKDSGNGVITPEDMTPSGVDAGDGGTVTGPDMVGSGGPCTPSNGGVEICDGLDNDCNGKVDDVPESKLIGDPKNCGACGNECKFNHAFGVCVGGFDGGMPTCTQGGCQPGYVDLDGDPTNGCEYVCTPTTPATEVCDGKDNDCNGEVDEGFTNTWFDAAKQMPKYDSLLADCGQCGTVCDLGPGTVMACQGTGTNGRGQCAVVACFNGNDAGGMHQTYRHNPAAGNINVTGCEYHCPKPATTSGTDCNPNGACTFPAETCNGIDDDCDFTADNNLTDPGLNGACPDGAPGKLCTSGGANPTCGKGVCMAGTYKCIGGGLTCINSTGPSPETCNGTDDDCDGKVDNGFTATWQDAGNQMPAYDSDPAHCGSCVAPACALPHGTNFCRVAGGDAVGSCAIAACDPGWSWVTKTNTTPIQYPADGTCTVDHSGTPRDSTHTTTGIGCFYQCGSNPNTPETCDGIDNDCDGCIDNGLTAPPICSTKGECSKTVNTVKCTGTAGNPASVGWKCIYPTGSGIDLDGSGNLTATELECDAEDNNCNGACDENFADVPITTTAPDGTSCNNPRSAKSCAAGQGVCRESGSYACNNAKTAEECQSSPGVAIGPNGDPTQASDEKCNGKDDDCNGLVDEPTDYTLGGTTYKGWHDPVVQLSVGADPFTGQAAHTVYLYAYEASRPDATATSPGSLSSRACANYGVLPWANVKLGQAAAACAGIKNAAGASIGRLCTAWEWQQACNGNSASGTHWSTSATPATYTVGVCNDTGEAEQRCNPAATTCTKSCNAKNQCTCSGDADCGGASGSCVSGVCTGSVCPSQCASGQTCNASGQCSCTTNADCAPGFSCNGSNICVGNGAWPTGSIGTAGASKQCYVDFSGSQTHDLSGNLQEWTSTPVSLKSGSAASMTATSGGTSTVTGLTSIFDSDVGAQLIITSATDAGTYDILTADTTNNAVTVSSTSAVAASGLSWQIVYNKVRGGNYATTNSGGDACEFDFDIQKASFANADVGFRCCSDVQP